MLYHSNRRGTDQGDTQRVLLLPERMPTVLALGRFGTNSQWFWYLLWKMPPNVELVNEKYTRRNPDSLECSIGRKTDVHESASEETRSMVEKGCTLQRTHARHSKLREKYGHYRHCWWGLRGKGQAHCWELEGKPCSGKELSRITFCGHMGT